MGIKKYYNVIINNPIASIWGFVHKVRRFFPLDYYLGEYSFFPDFITILITERCNFKCDRCATKSPLVTDQTFNELSLAELKKFIDQLASIKPFIYFSGGEPLLRKDIFELIRYIKSKKMLTGLVSNGSFLNQDNVNEIIDSGLDFFSVSIDGPKEYHDKVRGVEGAFDKAVNGLRLLIQARKTKKASSPNIKIASIIDPQNLDNSIYVIDLANELEVDELAFGNLMFYTTKIKEQFVKFKQESELDVSFINGVELKEGYSFNLDQGKFKKFLDYAHSSSRVPVSFVPEDIDSINNYYSFKELSPLSKCLGPWFSLSIMPDGSVTPCQGFILGNIKDKKLMQLWNKGDMKKFRARIRKKLPPACFRCGCGVGQKIRFDTFGGVQAPPFSGERIRRSQYQS